LSAIGCQRVADENEGKQKTLETLIIGQIAMTRHYTNVVEPVSTTITGLTRDRTFLIEIYPDRRDLSGRR